MVDRADWVAGSLLSFLTPKEQEHLIDRGTRRWFAEREVLMLHGDPSNHVLVLLFGWVRVSKASREDQEVLLALRGPGDVLGDLAALNGWARTATVRAMDTKALVVQLTREQFVASLHEHPAIAIAMVKQIGTRLREAESVRVDFATLDVTHRVAAYLIWLSEQHGKPGHDGIVLDMPLTQQDIASRVSASLRAVARSMALLRKREIVRTQRRQVVIMRPDALHAFHPSMPNDTEGL